MDEPISQQEEPDERQETPPQIWEQLCPDIQSRVLSLLAEMAYKYVLAQRRSLPKVLKQDVRTEVQSEIQCRETQDH